jgi:hypothetical protein
MVGRFRSRVALQAEVVILRHQLNVLRRKSLRRAVVEEGLKRLEQNRSDLEGNRKPKCQVQDKQWASSSLAETELANF